jgi:hypothetical protein
MIRGAHPHSSCDSVGVDVVGRLENAVGALKTFFDGSHHGKLNVEVFEESCRVGGRALRLPAQGAERGRDART